MIDKWLVTRKSSPSLAPKTYNKPLSCTISVLLLGLRMPLLR
jgi:hypothetical protein